MITPAAFTFVHICVMRASVLLSWLLPSPVQRSCVFRPSDNRMITCEVLFGSDPAFIGSPSVSVCQPHARPMVWFVAPPACMLVTSLLRFDQPVLSSTSVRPMSFSSVPQLRLHDPEGVWYESVDGAAGKSVAVLVGVVFCVS